MVIKIGLMTAPCGPPLKVAWTDEKHFLQTTLILQIVRNL